MLVTDEKKKNIRCSSVGDEGKKEPEEGKKEGRKEPSSETEETPELTEKNPEPVEEKNEDAESKEEDAPEEKSSIFEKAKNMFDKGKDWLIKHPVIAAVIMLALIAALLPAVGPLMSLAAANPATFVVGALGVAATYQVQKRIRQYGENQKLNEQTQNASKTQSSTPVREITSAAKLSPTPKTSVTPMHTMEKVTPTREKGMGC